MARQVPTSPVSISTHQRKMISSVNKEFLDEISVRYRDNRPGPDGRIAHLRHGDTLHVVSIDRLAVPWWICAESSTRSLPKAPSCTSSKNT